MTSVFPAPVRPALHAKGREHASRITQEIDGRRVGTQAWALYPKIREVDRLLESHALARARIYEVHPEVSFWAWNAEQPIREPKRKASGHALRLRLAEKWLGGGVLIAARAGWRKSDVADDDVLDAIAALWTATRIVFGQARTLPIAPPVDSTGLPMRITY